MSLHASSATQAILAQLAYLRMSIITTPRGYILLALFFQKQHPATCFRPFAFMHMPWPEPTSKGSKHCWGNELLMCSPKPGQAKPDIHAYIQACMQLCGASFCVTAGSP